MQNKEINIKEETEEQRDNQRLQRDRDTEDRDRKIQTHPLKDRDTQRRDEGGPKPREP